MTLQFWQKKGFPLVIFHFPHFANDHNGNGRPTIYGVFLLFREPGEFLATERLQDIDLISFIFCILGGRLSQRFVHLLRRDHRQL